MDYMNFPIIFKVRSSLPSAHVDTAKDNAKAGQMDLITHRRMFIFAILFKLIFVLKNVFFKEYNIYF